MGASSFDIDNLQLKTDYSPLKAYGISKLCNVNVYTDRASAKRTYEGNQHQH
ncbi:MAG: hypothetical protein U5J63_03295 [Fodinibius sp.]|nr:hypothetical protein [Fodinibius sp.]